MMKLSAQERIENAALLNFSHQGFYESSISEIAKQAQVSEATIFRLFKTKRDLYLHVIRKSTAKDHSLNFLFPLLTFENLEQDLMLIVEKFFEIYFEQIHVIRIFISNIIQFSEIRDLNYLIIPNMKSFIDDYLLEMSARKKICGPGVDRVSMMILSSILKDVAFMTTFEKIEELDDDTKKRLSQKWKSKITSIISLFIEHPTPTDDERI